MSRFYFTYGTDGYAFEGGWTEVLAPDINAACKAFNIVHPTDGLVKCAGIYADDEFTETEMYKRGNFGKRCHEVITFCHALCERSEKRVD